LILDWAAAREYRPKGDNPARWRGHLDKLLPARSRVAKVRNQPALPYADLPAFLIELRERGGISSRALEWTILTAARTGETIGARWDEVDLAAKVWTVPADRTKSAREHRVPLTPRALAILSDLPREKDNEHVFIGGKAGAGLSNMAMLELLKEMRPGLTVHGFRSTFRTWAAERTNYAREIAEAALAHVIGDKTEAAYQRGDALEKRRRLMTAWAEYCASTPAKGPRVVKLREAK
jgi:integrase